MSVRRKLGLIISFVFLSCFALFISWILDDIKPRHREALEDALIDHATVLASMVDSTSGLDFSHVETAVKNSLAHPIKAQVFGREKTSVDIRVYGTDAAGKVLYDSAGRDLGKDYSNWRDVALTLRGDYGARTTHDQHPSETSTLYVGSPIMRGGKVLGVLSLGKSSAVVNSVVRDWKRRVIVGALVSGLAMVLLFLLLTSWITTPVAQLTNYAREVRDGRKPVLPNLASRDLIELGAAFEEMRTALDGKQYIERYVQTLTHEIKAPLTAIRACSELLSEELPDAERQRFLASLVVETARIQHIVDSLLRLSSVEAMSKLNNLQHVQLSDLVAEVASRFEMPLQQKGIELAVVNSEAVSVKADPFLLAQSVSNLLQNALDFTPRGGRVEIRIGAESGAESGVESGVGKVEVDDTGVGIPEFAEQKIFERFYSLGRPDTKIKSSGLGLSFVREVMLLHGGSVEVTNRNAGGVTAVLRIPADGAC